MGGGDIVSCCASEDELSLENDYPEFPCNSATSYRDEDGSDCGLNGVVSEDMGDRISSYSVEFDGTFRRRKSAYDEIMKNYDERWVRKERFYKAKSKVLRYIPGSWINDACGKRLGNYIIPKTTTLLLVGPKGSGKSSLVNKISRVFEDDKFASERAQVSYSTSGEGTFFLEEYMIPRGTSSFCLFDSRGLLESFDDNEEMVQQWMTKGVHHGELVIRDSDSYTLKMALNCKARQSGSPSSEIRKVNFVIFVVNGFSVLKSMNTNNEEENSYMETVVKNFNCPYLSFKDDKPVVAVTHGDLLSVGDRARVRIYLGEKLGVPPAKQIFDIPENFDPSTELMIVDMIRYALEHADKNLPYRASSDWTDKTKLLDDNLTVFSTFVMAIIVLALLFRVACVLFPMHRSSNCYNSMSTTDAKCNTKPEVKYPNESVKPLSTFPSNLQSTSTLKHSLERQRQEKQEPQTVSPPPRLKSVIDRPRKPRRSRSSSHGRVRHPKSASVKWHKIRHLWWGQ